MLESQKNNQGQQNNKYCLGETEILNSYNYQYVAFDKSPAPA